LVFSFFSFFNLFSWVGIAQSYSESLRVRRYGNRIPVGY
jgi:hypothetical protein